MAPTQPCPLCNNLVPTPQSGVTASRTFWVVKCRTCGEFVIDNDFITQGWPRDLSGRLYHLSAMIKRSKSRIVIDHAMVGSLLQAPPADPPVLEKIDTVVRWLADQSKEFGQAIKVEADRDYPIATCRSDREFRAILEQAFRMGYLEGNPENPTVSVKGWQRVAEPGNATSNAAFVAMPFAADLVPVKEAIFRAVSAAGYQPVRVDEEEYVGGVMDKIVALIRSSRFMVADFTRNRGGVYYEAGFAAGLGIPVIPICERRQLESTEPAVKVHFDVHHLNFLGWDSGDLSGLSEKLENRIRAVLGRGTA